jgi:Bacterial Ig-like domain
VAVYVNGILYTGQQLAAGSYTVTAIATDQYGNVSATGTAPKTLVISTGATGSFTVSGAKIINGQLSTASKTPSLSLSIAAPGGISSIAISTNGGASWGVPQAYAASVPVSLASGDGLYTIKIRTTDVAGNTNTFSLTVLLDTAGPTISASLSAPQGTMVSGTYDGTANITATISATDPATISSTTIKLDGAIFTGATINIYTLAANTTHTLLITSTNALGTSSTVSVTFTIDPSLTGVEDLVRYAYGAGLISSSTESSLLGYLTNTKNTLATNLTNFEAAVKTDSSGSKPLISSAEAALFTGWAQALAAGK